ncbi:DUF924 domain-containing protein [cyanobacterium endosymbiont of Rhopalodia gibberula]|nr:DUF924 domain-containing protein [cyanobacterium endosymbiont of Rhopalodia gibberula]
MNNNYKDILYFWFDQPTSIDYGNPQKLWFVRDIKVN